MTAMDKTSRGNSGVTEAQDQELSLREMENVTVVFKSYETGLREATILPKVRISISLHLDMMISALNINILLLLPASFIVCYSEKGSRWYANNYHELQQHIILQF